MHADHARDEAELRALLALAGAVARAHRLEDVLDVAADEALRATGAASVSISRWERRLGRLRTLVNAGDLGPGEERHPRDETYPVADLPFAVELLERGRPQLTVVDDPDADAGERRLLQELGMESSVAVPIVYEGRTWGELYVSTTRGRPRLDASDVGFLVAVCGQIEGAIGRAELNARLAELAYRDSLTGLDNRRGVEERLGTAFARARGAGTALSVALGDMDGLKRLNDTLGHAAGDHALRAVADALRAGAAIEPSTVLGRLGGDEFCVAVEGDRSVAHQLIDAVSDRLAGSGAGVRMSWGVAELEAGDADVAALLRRADAAQYAEKRGEGAVESHAQQAGRRARRDSERAARSAGDLAGDGLALLEGELADAGLVERAGAIAAEGADVIDAPAWSVLVGAERASQLRAVHSVERRAVTGTVVEPLIVAVDAAGGHVALRLARDGSTARPDAVRATLRLLLREAVAGAADR